MKATIEIIEGFCSIVLKAENEFEKTLIEDFKKESDNKIIEAAPRIDNDYSYGSKSNHRITIDIKKIKKL